MKTTLTLEALASELQGQLSQSAFRPGDPGHPLLDDAAFSSLAVALYHAQRGANDVYNAYCRQLRPADPQVWSQIPAFPIAGFRAYEASCIPPAQRLTIFQSSGTTQPGLSRTYHHRASLDLYEASLQAWFERHAGLSAAASEAVILTPPADLAPHSSLVHMFEVIKSCFRHSRFLGRVDNATGAWTMGSTEVLAALHEANERRVPVGILSTAFHLVHLLDTMILNGESLRLPPGSWLLETGGYKGRSRSVSKQELYELTEAHLGLDPGRILGEYGMCELSSQAYDLELDRGAPLLTKEKDRWFHLPPWARFQVIAPETGHPARDGETGLLRIFDLANVWSVLAIQTEDLAQARGDRFRLLGRAPESVARGCSLQLQPVQA